jgi:hypothetical protein
MPKMAFFIGSLPAITPLQEQMERHMNKILVSTFTLIGSSTLAAAHPDQPNALFHLLTEPDHLAILSLVAIATIFAFRKYRATR